MSTLNPHGLNGLHRRGTQSWFLQLLERRRNIVFTLDAAADEELKICEDFIGPEQDGLRTPWTTDGVTWCNPPYSVNKKACVHLWAARGVEQVRVGNSPRAVLLLPASIETEWCQNLCKFAIVTIITPRLNFFAPETGKVMTNQSGVNMLWDITPESIRSGDLSSGEIFYAEYEEFRPTMLVA